MLMRRSILLVFLLLSPLAAGATNYYVSPTGSDDSTGLSQATAWATIDNGDAKQLVVPGDTIRIFPGTYLVSKAVSLKTDGTSVTPVVYSGYGGRPLIDGQGGSFPIVTIEANHVQIRGIEVASGTNFGIRIYKDSCIISNCLVRDIQVAGIYVDGSWNQILRNLIVRCDQQGVYNRRGAKNNGYHGNTIVNSNTGIAIQVSEATARIFNNILGFCNKGITGVDGNIVAFNNIWGSQVLDYSGGITDSAGGLSLDPLFVDTAIADYRLGFGSPAIDAGIDVGYEFSGPAPDLGAFESGELHHLAVLPVRDTLSSDSTYQFSVVASDSLNNPAPAGILTWSHTFGSGSIDSNGLFSPVGVGTGTVTVTSSLNGVTATTGSMYVRPGVPIAVTVIPDTLTISAGASQLFSVSGIDKNANAASELSSITWSLAGNTGSIDSTGLFSATKTGDEIVSAHSSLGLSDQSDTIRVIPGPLATLDVLPSTNVVSTLQTYQYFALGYDAYSNLIADYTDSVAWSVSSPLGGSVSPSGLYTAGLVPGSYWVIASYGGERDSGAVTVTLGGGLDHIRVELFDGTVVGALALTTDNDSTQLYARGYTAANALIGDVAANWFVLGPQALAQLVPDIGASTELRLSKTGQVTVAALHASGLADSTGIITISSGAPAWIRITPTTDTVAALDTLRFSSLVRDADMNLVDPAPQVAWLVTGGIGSIDSTGLFTAQAVGHGQIIATAGSVADTSDIITVIGRTLASLLVVPDSVAIGIGDTVLFSVIGLDSLGSTTDPGVITWRALGRAGTIDASGRYIANVPGVAAVSAFNQLANIADTAALRVEELYFSTIPLGDRTIRPAGGEAPIAEFRIDNYFSNSKTITAVSVRDLSRGAGSAAELAANMTSVRIYVDRDGDSLLTGSDSLLAEAPYSSDVMTSAIPPLAIPTDSGLTFIVTAKSALMARDGDTVDVALIPGVDIETADLTIVAGPPLSNSLGITQINGMVAKQISALRLGRTTISPADSLQLVYAVDIPRNGYNIDTLRAFQIANAGTASEFDCDSLVLFADNGNGTWDAAQGETRLGKLIFTGDSWIRSALNRPLIAEATRFYVAAKIAPYPQHNATFQFELPVDGLEVRSQNDGPIDAPVAARDTIRIQSNQSVAARALPIPQRFCIPGQASGPLLGLELTNSYSESVTIDTLKLQFVGSDSQGATRADLDSQIDSVSLWVNHDADIGSVSSSDSLIASAVVTNGQVVFMVRNRLVAASGGAIQLFVQANLNLRAAKNGNVIAFSIPDSTSLVFDRLVQVVGDLPLRNPSNFIVNAFPSSAITFHDLPGANLYAGQRDRLVMDFDLPRNGYSSDRLRQIDLVNAASLADPTVFSDVKLWDDVTGDGFTNDDLVVGQFQFTGQQWRLGNLSVSLDRLANRFFVTVSVASTQFGGGALQFAIPTSGVVFASGTNGPDDRSAISAAQHLVFPSNRVTAISIPMLSAAVTPGSARNHLMSFALYNGYAGQNKTLTQIAFSNTSITRSDRAYADHQLGQISLYYDSSRNRLLDDDLLIGSGLFRNGRLTFNGLAAPLPAESLAYFFVVTDLPSELIDGDSLSVSVAEPLDFSFSDYVNLNGDLPLTSHRSLIVDGSALAQFRQNTVNGQTLSPGDSDILLLSFVPALNGDQTDILRGLSVRNVGTADTSSLSSLRLWCDKNSNDIWDGSDSLVDDLTFGNGQWSASGLGLVSSPDPQTLLLVGRISPDALPDASIRLSIPLSGVDYESDNDGPRDSMLLSTGSFTVSGSALHVSVGQLSAGYTVGQNIILSLSVENRLPIALDSVTAVITDISDTTLVRLDSSRVAPVSLGAGASTSFCFYFTALQAGSAWWSLRAVSLSADDSSAVVESRHVTIERTVSSAVVRLLNSAPGAVTKGQTNIFPLSLGCIHPDTARGSASMQLGMLRLHITDLAGGDVPASSVFSRMVLATGYRNLAIIESVPSLPIVDLIFDEPILIASGTTQYLTLLADISATATASGFMISIDDAAAVPFFDQNSGAPVTLSASVAFPLLTAPTRIDIPSRQIAVSGESRVGPTTNYGQDRVEVLRLGLRHTGAVGSSPAQLTKLSVSVLDSAGIPVFPGQVIEGITLMRHQRVIGEATIFSPDSLSVSIALTSPVNLNPGEFDSVYALATVRSLPAGGGFRMAILDSSSLTVRDLNTGSILLAVPDSTLLGTSLTFPITSDWTSFRQPAYTPSVCLSSDLPVSVVGGQDSVPLVSINLDYSVSSAHSPIRLTRMYLHVLDSLGTPLDANLLFDRAGFRIAAGPLTYIQGQSHSPGLLHIPLSDTGVLIAPGADFTVQVAADVKLDAAYGHFKIALYAPGDLAAADVSDTSNHPGYQVAAGCLQSLSFETAPAMVLLPAGRPRLACDHLPPQLAPVGRSQIALFQGQLTYNATSPLGQLELRGLNAYFRKRTADGLTPVEARDFLTAIHVYLDGVDVATDTTFYSDSTHVAFATPFVATRGDQISIQLRADLAPTAATGNYVMFFGDSSFMNVTDKNLLTTIYPFIDGQSYPLQVGEVSIIAPDLKQSFTNYPNPFNPSRNEVTTIGYSLPENAVVDIEIFTITGESVAHIARNSPRAAGAHQSDSWSGVNDDTRDVQPGVYLCTITATYESGRVETYRRKIAVLR